MKFPTKTEQAFMRAISKNRGGLYGLEIVRASKGKIGRGSVYVIAGRLMEKGLIYSWQNLMKTRHPGLPRPRYRLTDKGELIMGILK